mmetsp:Transcript_96894/g.289445  ORF Transcript_96894/g.289445 Transcript_96894/m.289445 type:complete len:276 (-) Transcript_96894:116-943(-)
MAAPPPGSAARLSEALGVDMETSCAALERNGGDADAAAAWILSGQGGATGGDGRPATSPLGTLLEMGYPQAEAELALSAAGGDLDLALANLLSSPDASPPHAEDEPMHPPPADRAAEAEAGLGDCAICCEPLLLSDAAMRCAGRAGCHHYGHAACLAKWVQSCRRDGAAPTCPTCRGPLQLHRRNLREFLQQGRGEARGGGQQAGQGPVSEEDSDLLRSMLEQERHSSDDDPWSDIDFDAIAGFVLAAGAVAVVGLAAKALFDHFSERGKRDNSR